MRFAALPPLGRVVSWSFGQVTVELVIWLADGSSGYGGNTTRAGCGASRGGKSARPKQAARRMAAGLDPGI
jgi:hypothetical protein